MGYLFCPKCKKQTDEYHNYSRFSREIGEPFIQCGRCGTYILLDYRNEWDLKSPASKLIYTLWLMYPILAFGAIGGAILYELSKAVGYNKLLFTILGASLGPAYLFYRFYKDVQESRQRLADPYYQRELAKLELLQESKHSQFISQNRTDRSLPKIEDEPKNMNHKAGSQWTSNLGYLKWMLVPIIGLAALYWLFTSGLNIKQPNTVFYVLKDQQGLTEIFINDKPLATYELHVPGLTYYSPSYRVYGDSQPNRLVIKSAGKVIYEKDCASGSYLVNANKAQWVSYEEVAYGRPLYGGGKSLNKSPVGVYLIDQSTSVLVFGFDHDPPQSIQSKSSSMKDRVFFKLYTGRY